MLIQSGIDFNIQFSILDPDPEAPCSGLTSFQTGKLTDYETVLRFGEKCDIITIEIENVNTKALKELATRGRKVYPQPEVIDLIQDKRTQKAFYRDHKIPTADFILVANKKEVESNAS